MDSSTNNDINWMPSVGRHDRVVPGSYWKHQAGLYFLSPGLAGIPVTQC